MAKNWLPKEALAAIISGDKSAIQDISARFPLMANALTKIAAGSTDGAVDLINNLNERITVRTIESGMKDGVEKYEAEEVEATEPKEEKAPKAEKPAAPKADKPAGKATSYKGKSAKELYEICVERGLKVETRKDDAFYGKKLVALDKKEAADKAKKAKAAKAAKAKPEPVAEESWDEDEADGGDDWDV